MYRIHWGTTVCWRAVVGCGGGACVGVVRVVGSDVSCVVLGGSSWWSVVVVLGGWSVVLGLAVHGRARDMRCQDRLGGARVRVGSCVRPLPPLRFLP